MAGIGPVESISSSTSLVSKGIFWSISQNEPNVFIPQNFSHVKDDSVHYPHKILDDVRGTVWFMKDRELGLPYIYINLLILSPCVNKDPKEKLKSIVYSKVLSESLRDVADMAGEAGLTFGVERNDRGIATYFAGYSDKMFVLFKNVLDALSCDLKDNDLLNKIKRSLKSDYLELEQGTSYAVATYYKYDLMHKNNINYSKYIKMIDGVTLKDVNLTRKNIFKRFAVESYVYGNLNATDAEKIVDDLFNKFNPEKLDIAERPKDFIIKNPRGSRNSYALKCKAADSCWTSYFDFGHRHIRLSAVIQLGFGFLKGFFFDQMRNKKKLGYVVESRLDFFEHVLGISFTVCSEFFDTFLISTQAKKVFNDFIAYLDSLSEQELESSRNSLIAGISKNNRTIEVWMSEIVLTAAVKGDPDYGKKLCAEIATVTRQELIEVFYSNLCGSDSTSISVYANGTNSKHKKDLKKGIKDTGELFMDDVFQFKDGATFYQ